MNAFKHGLAVISETARRRHPHRARGELPHIGLDGFLDYKWPMALICKCTFGRETNGTVCVNRSYGARTFSNDPTTLS